MNTAKQVNAILGLFMVFLIGTTLYFLWDTSRADEATDRQLRTEVERGAHLYSLNCRSCHGITGLGAAERSVLPGAPLNVDASRGINVETGELALGQLGAVQRRFTDTLNCGRVGTRMPPWSQEQGGALNFYQIEQMVTFLTGSRLTSDYDPPADTVAVSEEGWEFVWEEVNHADAFDPHKELEDAIGTEDTILSVGDTDAILLDVVLRLGGNTEEPQYELVLVTEINEDAGTVTVERAVEGSTAMEHEEGTEVFGGYVPPGTSITGEDVNVCGQLPAQIATPTPTDGGDAATVEIADGDTIDMGDNFFDVDGNQNPTLQVTAGETLTLTLDNLGTAIHNLRIDGGDGEYDTDDDFVSSPDLVMSGEEATIEFSFDSPGTFIYRCDFHPTDMLGTVEVVE